MSDSNGDNILFLFPLHGALLMPGTSLPLHIFEPRYVQMIREAMAREIPISVFPISTSGNYEGEICTYGVLQVLNEKEDGTFDILLVGQQKCRLTKDLKSTPYLSFEYEEIYDDERVSEASQEDLIYLRDYIWNWTSDKLETEAEMNQIKAILQDDSKLISYLTIFLIGGIKKRKQILNASTFDEKISLIKQTLIPNSIYMGKFLPEVKKHIVTK